RRAREQAGAIVTTAELRRHRATYRFAREAVGDELLEVVADLYAYATIVDRDHDEQPIVFAFVADAASTVFEQLHRVLVDVGEGLEGAYGGDDDNVAARRLEREDAFRHLALAASVDDVCKVVDRCGQLRQLALGACG